ncbi:hypothetical protein EST38_g9108 [Candolleomyces aberdarensis]|uniref:Uncharacterized protein n=1 Tax=Candolleomyces aberdarensis TaxID=2316362 RepID=A0A4Q2DD37_9AGAR|nr:hypothetical protein EST38_g9108 [Candolleomyces aberdarensis]
MAQGGDLIGELDRALSEKFEFKGNFYHHSTHPVAPNPALAIEGVGLVGLPLSDRDAKLILSGTALAWNAGKATGDVFDIHASKVTIQNPRWSEFVHNLASTVIWQDLGVPPSPSKPRLELKRLLLYQAGSKYTLQEDSRENDAFATVVVVLPSAAEGGQVQLSHAAQKEAIELSQDSLVNTSVLAWYTGVVQKVKPIKSSYRLALFYSLINTQSPAPTLPDMYGAVAALRRVLGQWKDGTLAAPSPPLVVYLLDNKDDQSDRQRGLRGLKGSDIHKVSHLLPIAKELSFSVCLARLALSLCGYADTSARYYHRTRPWGYQGNDSDEDNIPGMHSVDQKMQEISELTCISGKNEPPFNDFEVEDDVLILKKPLADQTPQGQVSYTVKRPLGPIYRLV